MRALYPLAVLSAVVLLRRARVIRVSCPYYITSILIRYSS
jgi:hypothetical protein